MHSGNNSPNVRWALVILLTARVTIGIGGVVLADSIVLNPVKDTTLYDDNELYSNGAGSYMFTGQTNGISRS